MRTIAKPIATLAFTFLLGANAGDLALTGLTRTGRSQRAYFVVPSNQRTFSLAPGESDLSGAALMSLDLRRGSARLMVHGTEIELTFAGGANRGAETPAALHGQAQPQTPAPSASGDQIGRLRSLIRSSTGTARAQYQQELEQFSAVAAVHSQAPIASVQPGQDALQSHPSPIADSSPSASLTVDQQNLLSAILARPQPTVGSLMGTTDDVAHLRSLVQAGRGQAWQARVNAELDGYRSPQAVWDPPEPLH